MPFVIRASALAAIRQAAGQAFPSEACGLLLGADGHVLAVQPVANVHPDAARHFEIDPAVLIAAHKAARAGGPDLLGYFHSHPNGLARPSATDAASAARDGKVWAIAARDSDGSWGITCWHDGRDGFEPLSYTVAAG